MNYIETKYNNKIYKIPTKKFSYNPYSENYTDLFNLTAQEFLDFMQINDLDLNIESECLEFLEAWSNHSREKKEFLQFKKTLTETTRPPYIESNYQNKLFKIPTYQLEINYENEKMFNINEVELLYFIELNNLTTNDIFEFLKIWSTHFGNLDEVLEFQRIMNSVVIAEKQTTVKKKGKGKRKK